MAILSETDTAIALEGARRARRNLTGARIRWMTALLVVVFIIVIGKLIQLGATVSDSRIEGVARDVITASRPTILDRNGLEMAVDVRVPSLFAEPKNIVDVEEAVRKLHDVLPDLDVTWLRNRLTGEKGFVWIKRELTPALEERILNLGIPGLDFVTESKRFYPPGEEAAHILGAVNIDNQGTMGLEKFMDDQDLAMLQEVGLARDTALAPVDLAIDLRVQHVMFEQLSDAMTRYKATAAAGAMMDVRTGEIVAMVSLPDFDPNTPASVFELYNGQKDQRFNRITSGTYELGSTFKTVTMAGALDSGSVRITDQYDARFGVKFGRYTIDDFHGKHRILSVPEIYKYSSNIGTIHVMQKMGKDNFRAFLSELGFDKPLALEVPEIKSPRVAQKFSEIAAATASFGHGLSVTPLHMLRAVSAFVNDGNMVPPTLYKRSLEEAVPLYTPVISKETSREVRYLMRLNALEGSGTRMNKFANGYRVGGKTGTAEKVVKKVYSADKSLAVFASAFPLDNPRYAMIILVDEPKAENAQSGRTAGWNAGEVTGRIVQAAAPMLGISPDFSQMLDDELVPPQLR